MRIQSLTLKHQNFWLSFKMVKGLLPISSWKSNLISKHFTIQWPIPTKLLASIAYQCQHKQIVNYFLIRINITFSVRPKGFPKILGLGFSRFRIPDFQYFPGFRRFWDPESRKILKVGYPESQKSQSKNFRESLGLNENIMLILIKKVGTY